MISGVQIHLYHVKENLSIEEAAVQRDGFTVSLLSLFSESVEPSLTFFPGRCHSARSNGF